MYGISGGFDTKQFGFFTLFDNNLYWFLEGYSESGGCDEGPACRSHAGCALFDSSKALYDLTDEKIDTFDKPLIGKYSPVNTPAVQAWYDDPGVLIERCEHPFLAIKGGHNNKSHHGN
ncbi:MAG: hypothetical protein IJ428_06340 [Clostridia bacterium]|nr:hypothetical protein [Clostridia bacterium]